ncbi:MAG: hypothetical protein K6B52_07165 [Clostridiales bacterium]|nr:hypothetical protein [Clostridiales bacterium]
MRKHFKNYAVIWAIALVVFNAVVFIAPNESEKYSKFGGAFWAGYTLIMLAFIGQFAVSYFFFKEENKDKVFLNLPMFSWSLTCLVMSLVFGTALMIIPEVPQWLGAIIALVILGFYAIAVIASQGAAEVVSQIGNQVTQNTAFIKEMTLNAENTLSKAKTDEAKEIAKKVYEALRYSNKSSHSGLDEIEGKIKAAFSEFSDAITSDDDEMAKSTGSSLLDLITERDKKAKLQK